MLYVCMFKICVSYLYSILFWLEGVCLHPFLICLFLVMRPGSLRQGPMICWGRFDAWSNFPFYICCSSPVIWGSGWTISLPFRDLFQGCCIWHGFFLMLCLRIFQDLNYSLWKSCTDLVCGPLDGQKGVPVYMEDKSLTFRLDCISNILKFSVFSPGFRVIDPF
jgi:hypothetical protein